MRPWIAMAAAFALALQMLLGGILATQAEAATLAPDSPFAICLSDGSAPADHNSDKTAKHPSCVLCTVAKTAHALIPTLTDGTRLDVRQLAAIVSPATERIVQFISPTGQFQRGPPALAAG
jgi:hypothetical protein